MSTSYPHHSSSPAVHLRDFLRSLVGLSQRRLLRGTGRSRATAPSRAAARQFKNNLTVAFGLTPPRAAAASARAVAHPGWGRARPCSTWADITWSKHAWSLLNHHISNSVTKHIFQWKINKTNQLCTCIESVTWRALDRTHCFTFQWMETGPVVRPEPVAAGEDRVGWHIIIHSGFSSHTG